jgi:hypothetical protein
MRHRTRSIEIRDGSVANRTGVDERGQEAFGLLVLDVP